MKDKLAAYAKEYAKLYKECNGLCGINEDRVHLTSETFEKMFSKYETQNMENDKYPKKEFTTYDGVIFVCLVKGEKHEDV